MTADNRTIAIGNRNDNPADWTPFAWEDPKYGSQVKGEVHVIRQSGTSGNLMAGLWRTGHEIAGCEPDGSCWVKYTAPLGDETMLLLEGTAVITEVASGRKHEVGAGTIIANPKHVDLYWEISAPFLKKFWVMWDSPNPAVPEDSLIVGNVNDDPDSWPAFSWAEPDGGTQEYGEYHLVRPTGSTGTYRAGIWRSHAGAPGAEADGTMTFRTTCPHGDETSLILEGRVTVTNEETGEDYHLVAGDAIGLPSGLPVTWKSTTPFVKRFLVVSHADV